MEQLTVQADSVGHPDVKKSERLFTPQYYYNFLVDIIMMHWKLIDDADHCTSDYIAVSGKLGLLLCKVRGSWVVKTVRDSYTVLDIDQDS